MVCLYFKAYITFLNVTNMILWDIASIPGWHIFLVDQMAIILQKTYLNAFSSMKIVIFWFKFQLIFFLTITQWWFE